LVYIAERCNEQFGRRNIPEGAILEGEILKLEGELHLPPKALIGYTPKEKSPIG
jgi:hypothetical protein